MAELTEQDLLDPEAAKEYHFCVWREEHCDQPAHDRGVEGLEGEWPHYSGQRHYGLCTIPRYVTADDRAACMWAGCAGEEAARAEGEACCKTYFEDSLYSRT